MSTCTIQGLSTLKEFDFHLDRLLTNQTKDVECDLDGAYQCEATRIVGHVFLAFPILMPKKFSEELLEEVFIAYWNAWVAAEGVQPFLLKNITDRFNDLKEYLEAGHFRFKTDLSAKQLLLSFNVLMANFYRELRRENIEEEYEMYGRDELKFLAKVCEESCKSLESQFAQAGRNIDDFSKISEELNKFIDCPQSTFSKNQLVNKGLSITCPLILPLVGEIATKYSIPSEVDQWCDVPKFASKTWGLFSMPESRDGFSIESLVSNSKIKSAMEAAVATRKFEMKDHPVHRVPGQYVAKDANKVDLVCCSFKDMKKELFKRGIDPTTVTYELIAEEHDYEVIDISTNLDL